MNVYLNGYNLPTVTNESFSQQTNEYIPENQNLPITYSNTIECHNTLVTIEEEMNNFFNSNQKQKEEAVSVSTEIKSIETIENDLKEFINMEQQIESNSTELEQKEKLVEPEEPIKKGGKKFEEACFSVSESGSFIVIGRCHEEGKTVEIYSPYTYKYC
jgi:hypothetical protein